MPFQQKTWAKDTNFIKVQNIVWKRPCIHFGKNIIKVSAAPLSVEIEPGSEEEFIFEHYFGYNQLSASSIIEYAVHHPRWETFPVKDYLIDCDIENLYGKEFVPFITGKKPHSVFLAKGSKVTVEKPTKIVTTFIKQ